MNEGYILKTDVLGFPFDGFEFFTHRVYEKEFFIRREHRQGNARESCACAKVKHLLCIFVAIKSDASQGVKDVLIPELLGIAYPCKVHGLVDLKYAIPVAFKHLSLFFG